MPVDWGVVIPALASAGATTAGAIAASRQKGREAQASAQVPVDQLNQTAYRTDQSVKQQALDAQDAARLARALGMLQENAANLKAPGTRASNAVRGDILANAHDVQFTGGSGRIPTYSFDGGLHPDMFSDDTRALGKNMSREALLDQLAKKPTPFSDLPDADYSSVLNAPGAPGGTALPQGSRMDSVLQAIGQYGGMAAGVAGSLNGPPQAPPPSAQQPSAMTGLPGQVMPNAGPPPVAAPMLQGRYIPGLNVPAAPAMTGRRI